MGTGATRVGIFFNSESTVPVNMEQWCNVLPYSDVARKIRPDVCQQPWKDASGDPITDPNKDPCCTNGQIVNTNGFPQDLTENKRDVKLVYDGVRHKLFVHIKYGSTFTQVLQAHVDMKRIFGDDVNKIRIGMTASTGEWYTTESRLYSLKLDKILGNAAQSKVIEDERTVGAIHDELSKPFKITVNARDSCGHDRAVGGESVEVTFELASDPSYTVTPPTVCNGQTRPAAQPGICAGLTPNPSSDFQPYVEGTYEVRFVADKPGYYNVKLKMNGGAMQQIGRVYVAE